MRGSASQQLSLGDVDAALKGPKMVNEFAKEDGPKGLQNGFKTTPKRPRTMPKRCQNDPYVTRNDTGLTSKITKKMTLFWSHFGPIWANFDLFLAPKRSKMFKKGQQVTKNRSKGI